MRIPVNKRQLRWGLLALGAFAAFAAAVFLLLRPGDRGEDTSTYTQIAPDPMPFLAGLNSYDRIDGAINRLQAFGYTATRSFSHKPASSDYPPRDLDTLEVLGFEHLKCRGRLLLEFFNDRLYQAQFEPEELRQYLFRLHAAEPALRRDRNGRAEFTRGPLRVASNLDLANSKVGRNLNTRPYVLWQDLRLKQQLAEWESRYGAIAVMPD